MEVPNRGFYRSAGGSPPAILLSGGLMGDVSIFCDESGTDGGHSAYRLVTLVFHDQSEEIGGLVSRYEKALDAKGLQRIAFHCSPIMNGTKAYKDIDIETRKQMFARFEIFAKALPVSYRTFAYRRSEVADPEAFSHRLRKDIEAFLDDHLEQFQSFDKVKIYYDDAQRAVSRALHEAIAAKLSKQAVMYREAHPSSYHLFQMADYVCTMELAAIKFSRGEATNTDKLFLGETERAFRKNRLKNVRRKLME